MPYEFTREDFEATYAEVEPLYRAHYAEMQARLAADGFSIPDYDPRLDTYAAAARAGYLLTYLIRIVCHGGFEDREVVGYSNIYLQTDMHNQQFFATEDTIFVTKAHRNGVGRKFSKFILADLKSRGVKYLDATPKTDLRVEKIWARMGFKPIATVMRYTFEEA